MWHAPSARRREGSTGPWYECSSWRTPMFRLLGVAALVGLCSTILTAREEPLRQFVAPQVKGIGGDARLVRLAPRENSQGPPGRAVPATGPIVRAAPPPRGPRPQPPRFVRVWGKKGAAPGEFNAPIAIAIDKHDRI